MGKTTRREFIKKSGFTMLTVGLSQRAFFRHMNMAANSALTKGAALSTNDNILVVIQLAGGNDGHNMVIPMNGTPNSVYRQRRPTLAVPQDQILPIGADVAGNQLGFHPNLSQLKAHMDQGRVSTIQAVGYPNPNRSHFRSMDIWHTASMDELKKTGWLGDYFDATISSTDNPLMGVALGGSLPLSLRANDVLVPAVGDVNLYQFQTDIRYADPRNPELRGEYDNRIETFLTLNRELAPERTYWDVIGQTALDAYGSSEALQAGISSYVPDPNIVYPTNNRLALVMQQAAQIIGAGLETKILYVTLGGFDTHRNQSGSHALLMRYLDEAVDAFYRDMQRLGKDDKVIMMTWSEFGRLVPENGDIGTDHGAAAPQLIIGTPVQGGIVGEYPSLTDLNPDRPDVKYSIDFRSVYATILENWLGADSREILGGSYEILSFV